MGRELLQLKNAMVVDEREKSLWIEADCRTDGSDDRSLRFWTPKSQTIREDGKISLPQWLVEAKESDIQEFQASRGYVYETVEILIDGQD